MSINSKDTMNAFKKEFIKNESTRIKKIRDTVKSHELKKELYKKMGRAAIVGGAALGGMMIFNRLSNKNKNQDVIYGYQ